MTMKKIVTSTLLSGALVFGGVGSAFAADHTYEPGSAQQAIAARDDALIKINKWDRDQLRIAENLKLKPILESYLDQVLADIADLEKAIAESEKFIAENSSDASEKIAANQAEIEKLKTDIKIHEDAHGEDMAKYYFAEDYARLAALEAENAELIASADSPAVKVAKQALADNKAKLGVLENERWIINKELRQFRLNPCTTLGDCPITTVPPTEQPEPESEGEDQEAETPKAEDETETPKAEEETEIPKAEDKTETPKPEAPKAVASAERLPQTGAGVAGLTAIASLLGLGGAALRRKFN